MATGLDLAIAHEDLVAHFRVLVVEVVYELAPLFWQDKSFRDKIEVLLGILVLHSPHVDAKPIFAGQL